MASAQRWTGPALVSWPVLLLVVGWSAALGMFGGGASVTGGVALRGLLGAAAGVLACAFVALAWWGIIRRCSGGARLALAVLTLLCAGVIRAVAMQVALTTLGFTPGTAGTAVMRLANGVVTISVAFFLGAVAVSALRGYRETAGALVAEQARLVRLLEASALDIEERQADAVARVRSRLDEEIKAMSLDSAPSAVRALEDFSGDVVRPLSHALAQQLPEWEATVTTSVPRVRWIDVWRSPDATVAIQPLLLAGVCLVLSVPASVLVFTPRYGIPAALCGIAVLVVCLFMGRWWLRRRRITSPGRVWTAIAAILLMSSAAVAGTVYLVASADPSVTVFMWLGAISIMVFGLAVATASMMRTRMLETTARLDAVTRTLRWTLCRLNTQQWEQNGRLSRALHGPIQSLIQARVMRLRRKLEEDSVAPSDTEALRADLEQALAATLTAPPEIRPVSAVLRDLAETWDGVAEIRWTVAPSAAARLDGDALCAQAVIDLATEAVSNAVRHGRARTVEVTVDFDGDDLVLLRVTDDGAVPQDSIPGLGTTLLSRCAYDWSLSPGPTTLLARLPCAATAPGLTPAQ